MDIAQNNIPNDIQGRTRTRLTVLRLSALCSFALVALAVVATAQTQQVPRPDQGRSLHAQQTVQGARPMQPTDPSGYSQRLSQRPSVQDAMRRAVNLCNPDPGGLLYACQNPAVQYKIATAVWWSGVISVLCLLAALGYIWWYTDLWEVRQECFVRAAAVLIDQRDKAYQYARFAINKHNELVEVYDRLCIEFNEEEERRQEALAVYDSKESTQSLLPNDAGDATPVVETNAPVVEVQGRTCMGDQVFEINGVECVRAEDSLRRMRSLGDKVRNQRATIHQLADRLAEFEGTS
jgi:hypothetical protein